MKIWEYIHNGYYFEVKQTDTVLSSISVFHTDGSPEDVRVPKEEAEAMCNLIVNALNAETKETLS